MPIILTMQATMPTKRWGALSSFPVLGVAIASVGYWLLNQPAELGIHEALWVKTGAVFHGPASPLDNAVIDRLNPDYVNFDGMSFSGPLVMLLDDPAGIGSATVNTPFLVMPLVP